MATYYKMSGFHLSQDEEFTLNRLAEQYPSEPTPEQEVEFISRACEELRWNETAAEYIGLNGVKA